MASEGVGSNDTGKGSSDTQVVVSEINIYPLKSCRAVAIQSAVVDKLGLIGDRRLMVVDSNDRFLHQRKFPQLATVTAVLDEASDMLHLSAPDKEPLTVDLCRTVRDDRPLRQVAVWQTSLPAVDQGDEAAHWFQSIFESSQSFARLVALPLLDSEVCVPRPIDYPASMPRIPDRHLAFADAGPVLVISEASLSNLNDKFQAGWGRTVPMNRFRPNIVLNGLDIPFEEDRWLLVQIGNVPFMAQKKATRCKMTAVDQVTGETDKVGPLEVLRTYRAPRGPGHAEFGVLLIPLKTGGTIRVGDTVQVLEYLKNTK